MSFHPPLSGRGAMQRVDSSFARCSPHPYFPAAAPSFRYLLPAPGVEAQLYKLLLYEQGCFFKVGSHFGCLLCLPCGLPLPHGDVAWKQPAFMLHYAHLAFRSLTATARRRTACLAPWSSCCPPQTRWGGAVSGGVGRGGTVWVCI